MKYVYIYIELGCYIILNAGDIESCSLMTIININSLIIIFILTLVIFINVQISKSNYKKNLI